MSSIPPNPLLGVGYHSIGAMLSANCYAPQKYIHRWSWEIFWMTQAAWCWLIWPIIGAVCTIPQLQQVLTEAPRRPMVIAFLMGLAYGVGGTAFNISIRYIGFSLTYAIAVGLSSVLGTLVTPLVEGRFGEILAKPGAGWVMLGVTAGMLGIAICGVAGRLKEIGFRTQTSMGNESAGPPGFSLVKGLALSLVAGILSAVYGIAINDVARPIVETAALHGAGYWKGNIAYVFVNTGAFVTALVYSLSLARKNRSLGELVCVQSGPGSASLMANYTLAFLTGTLWYGQFFFYNLGHVRMGNYEFTSWAIHMIMLVLFSNLVAIVFREWKGCRPRTQAAIGLGLVVLTVAILLITYGNYLGDQSTSCLKAEKP
ncbi:MAG: L-rhamnose/proton symporter RhaT [Thermoguttaceae bacterium]